jgi:hypothetical protein
MAYDGIQFGARVDGFTERKLHAKVVDQILNSPTYFARLMGMGKPFMGKTEDVTVDVVSDTQGEWFIGLETLNSAAVNSTITLSYAHTAFTQPKVSIMLESFANTGATGTIPLDAFKYEKAAAEALQRLGTAAYGSGTANQPNGLGNIVDDSGTIGGQSRTTYSVLNATDTSWSTTLTLAKMATLHDAISASGMSSEEPNVGTTTKTVWSLYEQLLAPNVRASYNEVGYPAVSMRGSDMVSKKADLKNAAGFTALSYRGMPIMKDDFATSGYMYFLNERYFDWMGRTIVPDEYKDVMTKVNLGTMKAYEGTGAMALDLPSEYNGWFYQKPLILPNQAGMIARFYVIGQTVGKGFRRSGRGTGVTGV